MLASGHKLACLDEVRQGFIFMYKLRPVGTNTKAENLLYVSRHDVGAILIGKKTKELRRNGWLSVGGGGMVFSSSERSGVVSMFCM